MSDISSTAGSASNGGSQSATNGGQHNDTGNTGARAEELASTASKKLGEAGEAARETFDSARERASQLYTRGNLALVRNADPIPSLAIAAALGFLAGYAISGRR
ncbi:hypothetical protein [Ancylobacter lacus]|uniref:hypothetical protein n=1 Tax=Ancylobacter lacus TaxID=2579970 RepID=UPI001BCEE5EF|nr:hypothetical protein [Ancylobacter lacus]MBS7539578.1 hypothetical protein [Ancylobacter lacus]